MCTLHVLACTHSPSQHTHCTHREHTVTCTPRAQPTCLSVPTSCAALLVPSYPTPSCPPAICSCSCHLPLALQYVVCAIVALAGCTRALCSCARAHVLTTSLMYRAAAASAATVLHGARDDATQDDVAALHAIGAGVYCVHVLTLSTRTVLAQPRAPAWQSTTMLYARWCLLAHAWRMW